MAKAKAPAWLTTAFAEGVLELAPRRPAPAYKGALGRCWLAQHDERQRACSGPFERFHFISRQRVEAAMWERLRGARIRQAAKERTWPDTFGPPSSQGVEGGFVFIPLDRDEIWDLILLAAWDPRNGGVGCEGHHRRLDSHLTPSLDVPPLALPIPFVDFVFDWGLEAQAEARFVGFNDALYDDRSERTA